MPYSEGKTEAVQAAAAMEWVGALRHLPQYAIEQACRAWPGSPGAERGFKPVPAQILHLAVGFLPRRSPAEIEAEQERRLRLNAPERKQVTEEQAAKIIAELDAHHLFDGREHFQRMPPPGQFVTPRPKIDYAPRQWTQEEIDEESRRIATGRPYTDEEIARLRRNHGIHHHPEPDQ